MSFCLVVMRTPPAEGAVIQRMAKATVRVAVPQPRRWVISTGSALARTAAVAQARMTGARSQRPIR